MGFELVETRNVSGRGIIKIPFDKTQYRALKLYIDVIRKPRNIYLNKQWNPDKSFYANLAFGVEEYVYSTKALHFERECIVLVPDVAAQTLFALKCALDGIYQSFINLENALGLVHLGVENQIKDFTGLKIDWDTVRVQCYADTAIQLRLYRLKYDVCKEGDDDEEPPGEPPPSPAQVPPGTPLSEDNYPVSPPYSGDDTIPFPGDEGTPELPYGDACVVYRLTWKADYLSLAPGSSLFGYSQTLDVYGEIESIEVVPSPAGFNAISQISIVSGGILSLGQPCSASTSAVVTNLDTSAGIENLEIVSIDEVP